MIRRVHFERDILKLPRTIFPRAARATLHSLLLYARTVSRTAIAVVIKYSYTRQKMNIREEEDSVLIVAYAGRVRHFSLFSCLVRRGRRRTNR